MAQQREFSSGLGFVNVSRKMREFLGFFFTTLLHLSYYSSPSMLICSAFSPGAAAWSAFHTASVGRRSRGRGGGVAAQRLGSRANKIDIGEGENADGRWIGVTMAMNVDLNGDKRDGEKEKEEEEPDLFEYFDPRLSPHMYPDGIDASNKHKNEKQQQQQLQQEDELWNPLRLNIQTDFSKSKQESKPNDGTDWDKIKYSQSQRRPNRNAAAKQNHENNDNDDKETKDKETKPDLFDVFDPRLSPHEYPNGIPECTNKPESTSFAAFTATTSTTTTNTESYYSTNPKNNKSTEKVGVLLIGHGSKRPSSNQHLEFLARMYEEQSPDHYVVRVAHMEIASPTIEEGMRHLIYEERVGRIVCHPFFLSPGRHVKEDIPKLIDHAMQSIRRPDIPVMTTEPIGSSVQVMINAIDTIVGNTLLQNEMDDDDDGGTEQKGGGNRGRNDTSNDNELGGFFGEVKRLLDEQL